MVGKILQRGRMRRQRIGTIRIGQMTARPAVVPVEIIRADDLFGEGKGRDPGEILLGQKTLENQEPGFKRLLAPALDAASVVD